MDTERVFSVVVGMVLLTGIGFAAATLQTSVDTGPDDAIDLDAASLPIGSDEIGEYGDRLDSGSETTTSSSNDGQERRRTGGERGEGEQTSAASDGADTASGPGGPPTFLQWLLSLLRALLALLVRALPLLLGLGLLAIAISRRSRIATFLSRFVGNEGNDGQSDAPSFRAAPSNDVARAWYEMAALVDVDAIETTSPRECARLAVNAGADRSAVERVTGTFEEVRYGNADVTSDRRERARDGLSRVRAQLEVNG